MEVHLEPDLKAQLEQIARDTGRAEADLVHEAIAGFVDEVSSTRRSLDSRYEDLKSGRIKPIPGDEVEAYFRAKSAAGRSRDAGS